jgi:lipid II:glycine glycyltransferase (peptidoglycan interpeptide bridge formation enzyme)
MPVINSTEWDTFLTPFVDAHLLQTPAWGALKADFGWEPTWLVAGNSVGAQVLFRKLPFGYKVAYIPKGPVGYESAVQSQLSDFWAELDSLCQERKAVFVKVELDLWEKKADEIKPPEGFYPCENATQPQRTLVLDINTDEETILARMKQKTRYNIRLAGRKGVTVHPWDDIAGFYRMMQVTGERDAFGVHTQAYYQRAYELFHPDGECELLVAEYEQVPLAALMVFAKGQRAWYFYGASADKHRNLMPTYLLQWEAIRWARARGCRIYDLWGVPDVELETLETQFTDRADGLWGVYRFKRGFGGEIHRATDPWERIYNPLLYSFYRWKVRG